MQEETVKPAANTSFHAVTRACYCTRPDRRAVMLEVKDDARLPVALDLFDGDLMVGHGFDLRVNRMAVGVEGFTSHCGGQARWLEQRTVKGTAQQTLGIIPIE